MFSKINKLLAAASLAATMLVGVTSLSYAGFLDTVLAPNVINTFNDNSHEAFIDSGTANPGVFGVGDAIVGFVRLEQRQVPSSIPLGNTTYAIFSQQVASFDSTTGIATFAPTTVNGLTMSQITGVAAPAGSMVALYTTAAGFTTDMTNTAPPNTVGGATVTLADYFNQIKTGTLELIAGLGGGSNYFAAGVSDQDLVTPGVQAPTTTQILNAPAGSQIAVFAAALSVLTNNTGFGFANDVVTNLSFGPTTIIGVGQIGLATGIVRSAFGINPNNFLNASDVGGVASYTQCGATPCGFVNNVDIVVHPTAVPEPSSMILFGLGLAALGIYGRRFGKSRKD